MPRKRKEEPREWIVPMSFVGRGYAIVDATTAEEAIEKARSGDRKDQGLDETGDWEVSGKPSLNE